VLAFWYSRPNQLSCVKWHSVTSSNFSIGNGVRQGGILSPFLFNFYMRKIIKSVTTSGIGCYFLNSFLNMLAYADDIVLLAPSWHGMQSLLQLIENSAKELGMCFNTKKTVCMTFNPYDRSKIVCCQFPQFSLSGHMLSFVDSFKYLGHIIDNTLCDDLDINREVRNLFMRTNILKRR
jgi:hypothetical protein